jgi:hypothetical protein
MKQSMHVEHVTVFNAVNNAEGVATCPFSLVNLVHIRSENSRASTKSNAHAIVVEVGLTAARLVVTSKITRRVAGEINLHDIK